MDGKIRLICDRIEEGIAVLLPHPYDSHSDTKSDYYELTAELYASNYEINIPAAELEQLSSAKTEENGCYVCEIQCGRIISAEKTVSESAGENKKRLSALFKKIPKDN